ncbi:hypothetical protein F5Y13DRAFT_190024 [Hypoxylon sp. FL1857]|nr:hypothetical protein F5Y13DRAFT_190024 [Hypoxylon sp. FL1857]
MDRAIFNTSCVTFVFSLLAVGLRLYSRKLMGAGLGWDDGLILIAAALVVALFGLSIYLWDSGYDRVSLAGLAKSNQTILSLLLVFQFLYLMSMCLIKLSALCLYRRVFTQEKFKLVCKIIGVITILLYIAVFVETLTISEMAANLWDDPGIGKSIDKQRVDVGIAVFNVFGNIVIIILPIPSIWKLQMRVRTKISLTILFCLGLCVAVVSFLRLSLAVRANYSAEDLIDHGSRDMHLQVLEPELAIFSLCLPVLHPLWRKLAEKYHSIRSRPQDNSQTSTLAPLNQRHDDKRPMDWREALGCGGPPQYDVSINGGTQASVATKKGLTSSSKGRYKPIGSPSRQERLPQLTQIYVDRTFDISYQTALVLH